MRGMLASGLVWPLKWVGRAVKANRMNRKGLDRRSNFFLHFRHRNSHHPINGLLSRTKIVEMRGMAALGLVWPSKWVGRSVRDNRMYRQGLDGIWITQKMVSYKTRKIIEMRGMLAMGLVWPSDWIGRAVRANRMHRKTSWRTSTKKFLHFLCQNLAHQENGFL